MLFVGADIRRPLQVNPMTAEDIFDSAQSPSDVNPATDHTSTPDVSSRQHICLYEICLTAF